MGRAVHGGRLTGKWREVSPTERAKGEPKEGDCAQGHTKVRGRALT